MPLCDIFIAAQELSPSLENTEEYCNSEIINKGDRALKSGNVAAVEQADGMEKKNNRH